MYGLNFEPVFDIVRNIAFALGGVHHVGEAPQHHQMAVGFEIAGVSGMQPVAVERFAGGFVLLEVSGKHAAGPDQDFAGLTDLNFDARQRPPDRMQPNFVHALDRVVGAAFGLAVELPQLDAERAVEHERILAHRLAAGEGAAQPRQTELILDRPADQPLAERTEQAFLQGRFAAVELSPFGREGGRHEELIDQFLQPRRIFHANLDRGQADCPSCAARPDRRWGRFRADCAAPFPAAREC